MKIGGLKLFPQWRRTREARVRHVAHYERVLGTSLEIQVISNSEATGPAAEKAILQEIDRLELVFNAYNPQSELTHWQNTFESDIPVSPELFHVLQSALQWQHITEGAFNPCVEAFTQLWKQGAEQNAIPDEKVLEQLRHEIAAPLWRLDENKRTASRLSRLPLTLNALAKGYIIDRAATVAAEIEGVREVLLNIGGDLRHIGEKGVSVAIANPRDDAENSPPLDKVRLRNAGLAASGDYRRGFEIKGRHFSHIIDPRSGWPTQKMIGISVLALDTASADALSTAFSVLEPSKTLEIVNRLEGVAAYLIEEKGLIHRSARWNHWAGVRD